MYNEKPNLPTGKKQIASMAVGLALSANVFAETSTSDASPFYKAHYTETWSTVYAPFEGEGPIVEGTEQIGGYLLGIPGLVISLPVGVVGAVVTQISDNDFDTGFDNSVNAVSSSFSIVGKYALGLPIYALKSVFYDLPVSAYEASVNSQSNSNKEERTHGPSKIRR